jgi:UDP-glucose 4-epimerase
MRSIVTGGAGFIGSHLVDALITQGHEVLVIDDLSSGKEENLHSQARLEEIDIRNDALEKIIFSFRPQTIFHLAAQINIRRSIEEPLRDAQVNVLGSLMIIEAAKRVEARVIFSSTGGAIYGECERAAKESDLPRPLSPYGAAKLATESYLGAYSDLYLAQQAGHVALRYGNVYGPRQSAHGEAGVIAIFFEQFLAGITPTIFGDGSALRDYVYVSDVVNANISASKKELSGEIINIASGQSTSTKEIFDLASRIAEFRESPLGAPERLGELKSSRLDISKAKTLLDWQPQIDLIQGIERTWESYLLAKNLPPEAEGEQG